MALPPSIQTVQVNFGPFLDFEGAALPGSTTFTPSTPVRHEATGTPILNKPITVQWDPSGMGAVVLPATDSVGLNVSGFTYWVTHQVTDRSAPNPAGGTIALPAAAPVVDLDLLVPTTASNGVVVEQPEVLSVAGLTGAVSAEDLSAAIGAGGSGVLQQIVPLSPAGYAGLSTKDPDTLYLITVAEYATGATTGELSDSFATTSGLWQLVSGAASVTAGNLDLSVPYDTPGPETVYRTTNTYDLRGSSIAVKVTQLPTTGNPAAYFIFFYGTDPTHDNLAVTWEAGTLYFQRRNGTTRTTIASLAGLNLATDGWWRIRHDGTNIYWETGSDGVAYNTRATVAASTLTWTPSAGRVSFDAGYYENEATPAAPHVLVAGVNAS